MNTAQGVFLGGALGTGAGAATGEAAGHQVCG